MKWGLDPQGLKRSTSIQLTRSQIINVRNGDLDGRGSAIWSWLAALLYTRSLCPHHAIAWWGHIWKSHELLPTNSLQSFGKIAEMLLVLTQTFLLHWLHVIHTREGQNFLWQVRQWQMIWVQAGGGSRRSMVNLSIACLHGARYRSNVSGDTWFLRLFQGLGVYLEACQRLCGRNVH